MAGSYEHLRRDHNCYGGVDTSLVETWGGAIEAMTHMYWMIWLLSQGDVKAIRAASKGAIKIEAGKTRPPTKKDFAP